MYGRKYVHTYVHTFFPYAVPFLNCSSSTGLCWSLCKNFQLEYIAWLHSCVDLLVLCFCYDFLITPESERRVSYLSSYLGNSAWHLSLAALHACRCYISPLSLPPSDPTGESCSLQLVNPHCVLRIPTPIWI